MSRVVSLSEAIERYRKLTHHQTQYYHYLNLLTFIYGWACLIYPPTVIALQKFVITTPRLGFWMSLLGALCTTAALYRFQALRQQREYFENRVGIREHRHAIRRFNRKKL